MQKTGDKPQFPTRIHPPPLIKDPNGGTWSPSLYLGRGPVTYLPTQHADACQQPSIAA